MKQQGNLGGCLWGVGGVVFVVFLLLIFSGFFIAGQRYDQPPAIGPVTVDGSGNTIVNQAGDGNSASLHQPRPASTGAGLADVLAAFVVIGAAVGLVTLAWLSAVAGGADYY